MDSHKPNVFVGSDADTADEAAAQVASSPGPVSEQATDSARGGPEFQHARSG